MLFAETRDRSSRATGYCLHVAPVVRDGDSLITTPRLVPVNRPAIDSYDDVLEETRAMWRGSLTEARGLAERWMSVAPDDPQAHEYLGPALLRLGNLEAAADAFERAATLGTRESRRGLFWERIEALIKANRGAEARRVLDEAASDSGRDTSRLRASSIAAIDGVLVDTGRSR